VREEQHLSFLRQFAKSPSGDIIKDCIAFVT
jgi:hypothetical protein